MGTLEAPDINAANISTDLENQSNEQLLQRLTQSVEGRRRHRNKQKVVYAGYLLLCGAGTLLMGFAPLLHIMPSWILLAQVPYLIFVFSFMAFINWLNRSFYRRTAQERDAVVQELARRGEERTLGPLLELMDLRMSGSSKNWGTSRTVFIEALDLLLACCTPASFADLSDAQIHQLSPLLLLPEPELRAIISEALCRSGDARALRSLRKYTGMYQLQRWQKYNPFLVVIKAWLRKSKMPVLDKDTMAVVTRCCDAIEPRVQAEQRLAQLLRASQGEAEQPATQLLRGAMPAVSSEPAEQLLRSGIMEMTGEEEAQAAEIQTTRFAAHSAPPSLTLSQEETEGTVEIKSMR